MYARLILAAPIALCATFACADVSGSYRVEGRNPDGSTYSGTAEVLEVSGQVEVKWLVGNDSYAGTGPIHGDVITVDWGDRYPVVYVAMPDGELHGTWADGAALEKLTPR